MSSPYAIALDKELSRFVSTRTGSLNPRDAVARCCPVCGAVLARQRQLFIKRGYRFVSCSDCGLIFANPMLREPLVAALYENSACIKEWFKVMLSSGQREFDLKNYGQLYFLYRKHLKGAPGKLLDISIRGGLIRERKEYRRTLIDSLDFSGLSRACGQRRYPSATFCADFKLLSRKYDVVVGMEAMEHFFYPLEFVRSVHRVLEADGLFCGVCSNVGSLAVRILQAEAPLFDGIFQKFFFSRASLAEMLGRGGFRLLETMTTLDGGSMISPYLAKMTGMPPGWEEKVRRLCRMGVADGLGYKLFFVASKESCGERVS